VTELSAKPTKLRYRWSHRHPAHRAAVRLANRVLPRVPFRLKYGVTDLIRRRALPYKLLGPGSVAVQVGAPRDTLLAGRSRAMAFALRTGPSGRVLVVEPEAGSVQEFRRVAAARGLSHVTVRQAGAWSERATITLEVDPDHPATNFTEGTTEYSEAERVRFERIEVDALPLDDLIDEVGYGRVDLVSITTNGAETEALSGLTRTIARDRPYICLAQTQDSYADLMSGLSYELVGQDDRGFTFRHTRGPRV
jgi:FkbM family methyltransferase